jgi:hypothetical protein
MSWVRVLLRGWAYPALWIWLVQVQLAVNFLWVTLNWKLWLRGV